MQLSMDCILEGLELMAYAFLCKQFLTRVEYLGMFYSLKKNQVIQ